MQKGKQAMTTYRTDITVSGSTKKWLEDAGYEIIAIETYHFPDADLTDVIWGQTNLPPAITEADLSY
jgi:hypothetical protein